MNEEKIWFNQSLLYQKDKTYTQNGVLEISISNNTSNYQTFAASAINFSVSNDQIRKTQSLNYQNIFTKLGDGTIGWEEESPFDAIIITAGSPSIPQILIDQLKINGRMIIPVGDQNSQSLIKIHKTEAGLEQINLGGCRFVKLIGQYGW